MSAHIKKASTLTVTSFIACSDDDEFTVSVDTPSGGKLHTSINTFLLYCLFSICPGENPASQVGRIFTLNAKALEIIDTPA